MEPNGDAVDVDLIKRFGSFAKCAKRVIELERVVEEQSRTIEVMFIVAMENGLIRFAGGSRLYLVIGGIRKAREYASADVRNNDNSAASVKHCLLLS